jgi:transposase InsO family protein
LEVEQAIGPGRHERTAERATHRNGYREWWREVLELPCGPAETEAFWTEFLRSLKMRGLSGVQLVISDAHQELKNVQALIEQWRKYYNTKRPHSSLGDRPPAPEGRSLLEGFPAVAGVSQRWYKHRGLVSWAIGT